MTNTITNRMTPAPATADASGGQAEITNRLGKQDFLMLLVAQMKNQDPLKPTDDQQFIAQLAQFSTLETMQNLDKRLEAISGAQMLGEAAGLIGKRVEAALADGTRVSGTVSEVRLVDGTPWLTVGDQTVELSRIVGVSDTPAPTAESTEGTSAAPAAQTTPMTPSQSK